MAHFRRHGRTETLGCERADDAVQRAPLVARLEGRVNHSVAKRPEVGDEGRVRDRPRVVDGVEVCPVEDELVVPVRGDAVLEDLDDLERDGRRLFDCPRLRPQLLDDAGLNRSEQMVGDTEEWELDAPVDPVGRRDQLRDNRGAATLRDLQEELGERAVGDGPRSLPKHSTCPRMVRQAPPP